MGGVKLKDNWGGAFESLDQSIYVFVFRSTGQCILDIHKFHGQLGDVGRRRCGSLKRDSPVDRQLLSLGEG